MVAGQGVMSSDLLTQYRSNSLVSSGPPVPACKQRQQRQGDQGDGNTPGPGRWLEAHLNQVRAFGRRHGAQGVVGDENGCFLAVNGRPPLGVVDVA